MPTITQKITPNLWFDTQGEEAARFYASIFPDSEIGDVMRYGDAGPGEPGTVMVVSFTLAGMRFVAINGGPEFTFTEAVSLEVACEDQEEVDYYWSRLSEGGAEAQCGWLKDRYGLSWQVVPVGLYELLGDPDQGRRERAMKAMLGMVKLDLAALRAAADAA